MALKIENYALIGDGHSAALIGIDGSVDWLCLPRFDSSSVFAALLGNETNGRWSITPSEAVTRVTRRYLDHTLVLETTFETPSGTARVTDFMAVRDLHPRLVRIVEGVSGRVTMSMDLAIRMDYGRSVPWVYRRDGALHAIAGPNALQLHSDVELRAAQGYRHTAEFSLSAGGRASFVLGWHESHLPAPDRLDPEHALAETTERWRQWAGKMRPSGGPWDETVTRSLITLKALIYAPTGGIVAAPTTSLPEQLGGRRNWDYRYCWMRDATLTLSALLECGYRDEAVAWRDWLLRAAAGRPSDLQIMYGPAGERWLDERELDWLDGYEGSRPVRVGNAASNQLQLDVYGELMDTFHLGRCAGIDTEAAVWDLQVALLEWLESGWHMPDEGLWEVRGGARSFTHSKVMAWVAFDRAIATVESFGQKGPADRWRVIRDEIHREVCDEGFDTTVGSFVQSYGSPLLDASLLLIPQVGFLPADDPRVTGTIAAVERELMHDGFVLRYDSNATSDGLPPGEGAFLPCTLWLADALALAGQHGRATQIFERVLGLANDVGLLSEEYDPVAKRLVGNFPQAFSHLSVVGTAQHLAGTGPARMRTGGAHSDLAQGPAR
jgi:GH15 family glucan-1,4-alpha-glucosidase